MELLQGHFFKVLNPIYRLAFINHQNVHVSQHQVPQVSPQNDADFVARKVAFLRYSNHVLLSFRHCFRRRKMMIFHLKRVVEHGFEYISVCISVQSKHQNDMYRQFLNPVLNTSPYVNGFTSVPNTGVLDTTKN